MTTDAMRLELASRLVPGVEVWDAVEVELAVPFLLVIAEEITSTGDAVISRTFFAKSHHLASLDGSDVRLSRVDLFSPPGLDRATGWKLDLVSEVWECHEPLGGGLAWLFVLADGRHLSDSRQETSPRDLVRTRCLYKQREAVVRSRAVRRPASR